MTVLQGWQSCDFLGKDSSQPHGPFGTNLQVATNHWDTIQWRFSSASVTRDQRVFTLSEHTVYAFISIKFHNVLPIPFIATFISCIAIIFLYEIVTFPLFGAVNTKSVSFLTRPAKNDSRLARMTRRGLMELGVFIGGCYMMKRHSVLTFLMLVCSTTSNLLVST